jgi:hypothetical protein
LSKPLADFADLSPATRKASLLELHLALVQQIKRGETNFTILDLLDALPWFRPKSQWLPWRAFLCAVFGLPMTDVELAIFQQCTGRKTPPTKQAREVWSIVGRRGGKSRINALIGAWIACFRDYSDKQAPGQVFVLPIIAADKKQAAEVMNYLKGMFAAEPFKSLLASEPNTEDIKLKTGVTIMVRTGNFRTVRGPTYIGIIGDEIAFWRNEDSKNPDEEIINALRPGMATIPGSILMGLSSPYARRGVLWNEYEQHWGKENENTLVWQAETLLMHPGDPELAAFVAREYEKDPLKASAEYGAQFRRDVESYVSLEVIRACTAQGRTALPPIPGQQYFAFADPSGGTQDSMTVAIAHWAGVSVLIDAVGEWAPKEDGPFSPEEACREAAALLTHYGVRVVQGDRYGGEWPRERFKAHGITYYTADRVKNDIYRDFLPLLNSRTVELLDNKKANAQLFALDRRTTQGGRDQISHPPGGHDDIINAIAGVAVLVDDTRRKGKVEEKGPDTTDEIVANRMRQAYLKAMQPKPLTNPYRRSR